MRPAEKTSVFWRWIFSYLAVLLIPLALGFGLLLGAQRLIIHEYQTLHSMLQQQAGKLVDSYILSVDTMRASLLNDADLLYCTGLEPAMSSADRYSLVSLKQRICLQAVTLQPDQSFYIYLHNLDRVLSASSLYTPEVALEEFHEGYELDHDSWFLSLTRLQQRSLRVLRDGKGHSRVAMVSSIPSRNGGYSGAALVQLFGEDAFAHIFRDISFGDSTAVMLLDEYGQLVSSNLPQSAAELDVSLLTGLSGQFEYGRGTQRRLVLYSAASVPGWKYVTVIPFRAINEKTRAIRLSALLFCAVSLVFGSAFAWRLSRRQYEPIQNLLLAVRSYAPARAGSNEYSQLTAAFDSILEERNELQALWQEQQARLQSDFIRAALSGRITDVRQTRDIIAAFGISMQSDSFCVAVFCPIPAGDDALCEALLSEAERKAPALCAGAGWGAAIQMGAFAAMLFNLPCEEEGDSFLKLCDRIAAFAGEQANRTLYAVSGPCHGLAGVGAAYRSAEEQLSSSLFAGRSWEAPDSVETQALRQGGLIVSRLRAGEQEQALSLLHALCMREVVSGRMPYHIARSMLCGIASSAAQAALGTDEGEKLRRPLDEQVGRIGNAQTLDEMYTQLCSLLSLAGECFSPATAESEQPLAEEIIRCVEEHYAEYDFNVTRLAGLLSMNMSYLSKYFKETAGIGLHDYITQVRVNRAKELIMEENLSVTRAAARVGFENTGSFIRAFKRQEGVTPGSLRQDDAAQRTLPANGQAGE